MDLVTFRTLLLVGFGAPIPYIMGMLGWNATTRYSYGMIQSCTSPQEEQPAEFREAIDSFLENVWGVPIHGLSLVSGRGR